MDVVLVLVLFVLDVVEKLEVVLVLLVLVLLVLDVIEKLEEVDVMVAVAECARACCRAGGCDGRCACA